MRLKFLVDEDCVNSKYTAMFLGFPKCTWKCGKENCQNRTLEREPDIEISKEAIYKRYNSNPLTNAVICGGLEPFDSELDLLSFIDYFRSVGKCNDPIIIYTGYTEQELNKGIRANEDANDVHKNIFQSILKYGNIYVKYGRYIANATPKYDDVLGVTLASDNQYCKFYPMMNMEKKE